MITLRRSLLSLGGLALATAGAFGVARAAASRSDCPGKITCPVTGEGICSDQCPLGQAEAEAEAAPARPSCCLE